METFYPWMRTGENKSLPFHRTLRTAQSMIHFTRQEVQEVLACRTYTDTIAMIENIKKRKEVTCVPIA